MAVNKVTGDTRGNGGKSGGKTKITSGGAITSKLGLSKSKLVPGK